MVIHDITISNKLSNIILPELEYTLALSLIKKKI